MAYQGKHTGAGVRSGGKRKKKNKAAVVVLILLALLLLLFGGAAMLVNHYLNKIDHKVDISKVNPENVVDEVDEDINGDLPVLDADDVVWDDIEALDDGLINILLVGQDSRTGARERSDTMVVASINPETGKISLISFMRDLYVQMPEGYMDNRLNSAYANGGFPFLYEALQKNFGIACKGGFEVNFDGFKGVIDTLGGVDIKLTAAEAKYIGNGCVEGMNHLDGEKALTYSRIRYIDSDFYRTQRQRTVLMALFDKIKGSDMNTLLDLANTLLPMMKTDMSNTQIVSLLMKLAPNLSGMDVSQYRIPQDGAYYDATIRGMMVLVPDLAKNQIYLRDTCLPY